MLLFSILNFALYLKENPLNYLLLQSVFQMICKRFVSKRMMLLHVPTTPPWFLTHPVVNFTLHCSDKSNTPPDMFKHRFYELYHEFKYYYRIFTDGSKKGNRIAAAVVHRDNTKCVRLPDTASIFRAQLYALLLAIDLVRRSKEKNFVIFSDSMSSLHSINGFNLDSDLVQKFLKDYTILAKRWKKHCSLLDPKSCGNPR